MKINYKTQNFKITNKNRGYSCCSCEFVSHNYDIFWCELCCHFGKIWIKDGFNSDIFRL